jgi:hypothetical protein
MHALNDRAHTHCDDVALSINIVEEYGAFVVLYSVQYTQQFQVFF